MTFAYAFIVEYHGSYYHGWQYQKGLKTVQGCLQEALYELTGEEIEIFAAGRTDAGVHSRGQVIHMHLSKQWDAHKLCKGMNHFLSKKHKLFLDFLNIGQEKNTIPKKKPLIPFPYVFSPGISVLKIKEVPNDFHARFQALWRRYSYQILQEKTSRVFYPQHWRISLPLDFSAMAQGCSLFLGNHNFSYFRHGDCQSKNPWKTIDKFFLENRQNGKEIIFHVQARSFLHRQVRMMVGALIHLGLNRWTLTDLQQVLNLEKAYRGPQVAPAHGLFLEEVFYDSLVF